MGNIIQFTLNNNPNLISEDTCLRIFYNIYQSITNQFNNFEEKENDDRILKFYFDKAYAQAIDGKWLDITNTNQYFKNIELYLLAGEDEFENVNNMFCVMIYTCLVDLFKADIIDKDPNFIKVLLFSIMNSKLNVTNYKKYVKVLLNLNVIDSLYKTVKDENDIKGMTDSLTSVICDVDFDNQYDKAVNDSITYLNDCSNPKLNAVKGRLFEDDLTFIGVYDILMEQIEVLNDFFPEFVSKNKIQKLDNLKKSFRLSQSDQEYLLDIIRTIDRKYDTFLEKLDFICNMIDVFYGSHVNDNIITPNFNIK